MKSRCCRNRSSIGPLCITVLLCWAIMVTVVHIRVSYKHLTDNQAKVTEDAFSSRALTRQISIPPEVYNIKGKISEIAIKLYKAKKHVRGSKTSDYLKDAIEIMSGILQDLDIDKRPLAERKTSEATSVCPEEYKGTTFGYPFFYKGFEVTNCSYTKPMWKLVTIVSYIKITSNIDSTINRVNTFLRSVYTQYSNVSVVLSTAKDIELTGVKTLFPNLKIKDTHGQGDGYAWKSLVQEVQTPYVLVARNVEILTADSRLERLVREVESLQVAIAGSAVRTPNGHWDKGCYQTVHRNFTLKYLEGYDESVHECLFCDYITGPFLAKRETMQRYPFSNFDENAGLFEEWFLRIGKYGVETIVCPDSMFHINAIQPEGADWNKFISSWDHQKIETIQGQIILPKCKNRFVFQASKALSHCALQANADVVKLIMKTCEESNIICELQEGTALGAIKFGKVLPWERDADLTFLSGNYTAFQRLKSKFVEMGMRFNDLGSEWCCTDNRTAGGKFQINNGWKVELYGQHMMDSEMLIASGLKPTKVLLDGSWVNVPRNPGLFMRNRYGHEIYQHALHWSTTQDKSGWINYKTNTFMKCSIAGDHDCLDRYNADGNLPFIEPLP